MVERTAERARESEPQELLYEEAFRKLNEAMQFRAKGKVIIKGKEQPFQQGRQGLLKYLLHRRWWDSYGVPFWHLMINRIINHSGRHRHQGGAVLFVLGGKGYTTIDGKRFDWEKDDLILLPVKPDGVEHQHFNMDPKQPAEWLGWVFYPMWEAAGCGMEQKAEHPDWSKPKK